MVEPHISRGTFLSVSRKVLAALAVGALITASIIATSSSASASAPTDDNYANATVIGTGLEANTDGSDSALDTSLAAFTSASSISKAKRLAWNEHASTDPSDTELWSEIKGIPITKGTTYYFQVGTLSGHSAPATGDIEINLQPTYVPPSNDNIGNAVTEK
jgi:hypothetical protein